MSEKLDKKEVVTLRDALLSEIIQFEALVNLLDRKGLISRKELLEEMKVVHESTLKAKSS
jgi:hypothetical protein